MHHSPRAENAASSPAACPPGPTPVPPDGSGAAAPVTSPTSPAGDCASESAADPGFGWTHEPVTTPQNERPKSTMSIATKLVLAIVIPSSLVTLYGIVATLRFEGDATAQILTHGLALITVLVSSAVAVRRLVSRRLDSLTRRVHRIDAARPDLVAGHHGTGTPDADEITQLTDALDSAIGDWWSERDVMRRFLSYSQRDLQRTHARLETESRRAADLDLAKGQFLNNISHEMRTPMNGIMGMCELLSASDIDGDKREWVVAIQRCADSLMGATNDVLDLTRLAAGDLSVDPILCDLASTIQEVVDTYVRPGREKGVDVRLSYDPVAPRHLLVDAARVRQVVSILLSNAVKFTDRGSVTVSVSALRVTDSDARMCITVEDTGIGIPRGQLGRIFEKFTQIDASLTRRHGGTGLGLAVCRKLTDLLGGELAVESRPGEGSRFSFVATFGAAPQAGSRTLPLAELDGVRVLFVDDDPVSRRVMTKRLDRWRMRAHVISDPALAVDELHRAREEGDPYELCVIDYRMPAMTGADLARGIRADHALTRTPLVLHTSVSSRGHARKMQDAGFDAYLVKPVSGDMLRDALAAVLGQARCEGPPTFVTLHALAEHRTATGEGHVSSATSFRGVALVAEDNAINQMLAKRLLEKMGIEVDVASNGESAVERVAKRAYDIVLMDCQMPVMDGVEATERIRASEAGGSRVPIVAMTANALQREKARCLGAGMDDFITKPVDVAMLRQVLGRYLQARESPADGAESAAEGDGRARATDRDRAA